MLYNNAMGFIRPQKQHVQENPIYKFPKLFDAALCEFAAKSFDSASLNDILKAGAISKGSFYHKFADKMDLYLCLIDRVSSEKMMFTAKTFRIDCLSENFFEQVRLITRQGIDFALKKPDYYAFWKRHLAERQEIKEAVKAAFPARGKDEFEMLIRKAYESKQFKSKYTIGFLRGVLELFIYNVDILIEQDMQQNEILVLIDNLVEMLKTGLWNRNN